MLSCFKKLKTLNRWLFFSLNFDHVTWKPAIDSNRFSKFDHWLSAVVRLLSKHKLLTIYKRESSQKLLCQDFWMFFTVICDHYRCTCTCIAGIAVLLINNKTKFELNNNKNKHICFFTGKSEYAPSAPEIISHNDLKLKIKRNSGKYNILW